MASRDTEWTARVGPHNQPTRPCCTDSGGVRDRQRVARVRGRWHPSHPWRRHSSGRRQVGAALSWVVARVPRRAERQGLPGPRRLARHGVIAQLSTRAFALMTLRCPRDRAAHRTTILRPAGAQLPCRWAPARPPHGSPKANATAGANTSTQMPVRRVPSTAEAPRRHGATGLRHCAGSRGGRSTVAASAHVAPSGRLAGRASVRMRGSQIRAAEVGAA